jgi:hypothetical protein
MSVLFLQGNGVIFVHSVVYLMEITIMFPIDGIKDYKVVFV